MPAASGNSDKIAYSDQASEQAMATHGISRVTVHYFQYKSYRYTNLADAVAEAERDSALKSRL